MTRAKGLGKNPLSEKKMKCLSYVKAVSLSG